MSFSTKIHVWIGLTKLPENEFWKYFKQPKNRPKFCTDINLQWIDNDFMGYYYSINNHNLSDAIEQTPEPSNYEEIQKKCISMGIKEANAMFYYWGQEIISVEIGANYNSLIYIGCFNWD